GHSPSQGFAGVFYPGVPDLASASAIQLHPGEQTEANFALKSVPVYALSGVVSGYPAGQGVNFQVLTPAGLTVPGSYQFSAENGRFDFNSLAAGNYILRAYSQLAPDQPIRAEVPFTLSSDLHNLHLALAPSPSIPVILRTEDITSSSRSSVPVAHITPPGLAVSVCLLPVGPGANEIYASPDDPRNPQSLTLRNVESGHYSTVLQPFPPWYVASAEYGQTNLLTDDLIVSANSPAQPITIVLRNDSASLAGTVTLPDGYISPVLIVAVPERFSKASPAATYWYPARDKTPGVNEFFLDSLAPGDYLVYAFDQTQGIEFSNRDVMQPFASQATQVTLSAGQRAKVSLPLIRIQEAAQ
ncbi:MAG TPA: hypothetical protein VMT56_03760, partial [Candidatus Bathyarchaeia archaeon]|nr:hypothetical protein [Candidatus Bathyarchaeia archaeon]